MQRPDEQSRLPEHSSANFADPVGLLGPGVFWHCSASGFLSQKSSSAEQASESGSVVHRSEHWGDSGSLVHKSVHCSDVGFALHGSLQSSELGSSQGSLSVFSLQAPNCSVTRQHNALIQSRFMIFSFVSDQKFLASLSLRPRWTPSISKRQAYSCMSRTNVFTGPCLHFIHLCHPRPEYHTVQQKIIGRFLYFRISFVYNKMGMAPGAVSKIVSVLAITSRS